ncbi:MAG: polyprenyl synthetase family protein [Alistipes sp.]|jgi:geranylgeranyl diphosphate synthase type II|nr:polyprenyl synthetase family protein [Alistipes sp.]
MAYTNNEILETFEASLAQLCVPEEPELLYMPIIYSMSGGGKRLRPVLLLLTTEAFGGAVEEAMPAALAVEIFHNFTLLHDDIMDNADVRRGKPSVYAKWGGNVALLSGDAMLISAYKYLARVSPNVLPKVMNIFTDMALEVCEGQQYDMDFEKISKVSVEEYMQMIERKTSALLSGSAMIGATMAGASDEDVKKIYRFATELGLAFQLQDDVLDSYGDTALGKKIGGDILEGKKTFLMVQALSRASEQEREVLCTTHMRADISDAEKIATIKALYDKLDVRRIAEQQIELRFERALAVLDTLSIAGERTATLVEFARNLMGRKK